MQSVTELKSIMEQLDTFREQQETSNAHGITIDRRLDELVASIDAIQLQSATELKSVQEQLASVKKQQEPTHPNGLIVEGYFCFNIVRHQSCWYGFNQDTGAIDIGSLDAEFVEEMKKSKQCLTGDSIAEIKADILSLTLQEQLGIVQEQQESAIVRCTKIDGELEGLHVRIDAAQLQLATELKSIQERLCAIKEQAEGISHNPLVRVGNQMANLFILKSPNNE